MPGKGKMQITGKLGDVMQESVKAAKSYIRSKSLDYGIIPPIFDKKDFHIHVPEGATPKDGPSAGIGMVTSIISAITEIPVNKNVAMTGEITLRGLVLPIGGLKEKLLAAHRAGIKKVLIPIENKKDLIEVPKTILDSMEIIPVKNVDEVLKVALTKPLKRVEWVEVDQISKKEKEKKIKHSLKKEFNNFKTNLYIFLNFEIYFGKNFLIFERLIYQTIYILFDQHYDHTLLFFL